MTISTLMAVLGFTVASFNVHTPEPVEVELTDQQLSVVEGGGVCFGCDGTWERTSTGVRCNGRVFTFYCEFDRPND